MSLLVAIAALEERIKQLAPSHEDIECVAEGWLRSALMSVRQGANLLGEDSPDDEEPVPWVYEGKAPEGPVVKDHVTTVPRDLTMEEWKAQFPGLKQI